MSTAPAIDAKFRPDAVAAVLGHELYSYKETRYGTQVNLNLSKTPVPGNQLLLLLATVEKLKAAGYDVSVETSIQLGVKDQTPNSKKYFYWPCVYVNAPRTDASAVTRIRETVEVLRPLINVPFEAAKTLLEATKNTEALTLLQALQAVEVEVRSAFLDAHVKAAEASSKRPAATQTVTGETTPAAPAQEEPPL